MPAIFLTEQDALLLRQVLDEFRKGRTNSPHRRNTENIFDEGMDYLTPEVWIAKPQATIAALSGDTPGKGDVDIYYINEETGDIEAASGEENILYNVTTSPLEDTDYIAVWRLKDGPWITGGAGGGMGATNEIVEFKILSVSSWTASVFITSRPCGIATVTGESGGVLTVNDPSHCYLDEPDADLVGRAGWAAYMDPDPVESATGTGTGTGTDLGCEWRIFALCCPTC